MQLNLDAEYRASIIAQAICLAINCGLYYFFRHDTFIWIIMSTICFIGITSSKPRNNFFDQNIFNHLIVVLGYYILYLLCILSEFTYFLLIFIFTYIFFILKDNGFNKSVTIWTYIQAIMIGSSLVNFPFTHKIVGSLCAYFEAQFILYLCLKMMPTTSVYVKEQAIFQLKNFSKATWFNIKLKPVQLAIRGTLTAGILYIICVSFVTNDIKPNWAVIVAVGCLLRDDDVASNRSMLSCIIGSLICWPISLLLIRLLDPYPEVAAVLLWISIVFSLIFIFKYNQFKTYKTQIMGVIFATLAITCAYITLKLDSNFYLNLKMINNLLGLISAFVFLKIWQGLKKIKNQL